MYSVFYTPLNLQSYIFYNVQLLYVSSVYISGTAAQIFHLQNPHFSSKTHSLHPFIEKTKARIVNS